MQGPPTESSTHGPEQQSDERTSSEDLDPGVAAEIELWGAQATREGACRTTAQLVARLLCERLPALIAIYTDVRSPAVQAEKAQEELPTPDGKATAHLSDDGDLRPDDEDVVVPEPRVRTERGQVEIVGETSLHDDFSLASLHSFQTGSRCRTEAREIRDARSQPALDEESESGQEALSAVPRMQTAGKPCARATKRTGVDEQVRRSSRADGRSRAHGTCRGPSWDMEIPRGIGAIAIVSRTSARAPPMRQRLATWQSGGRPGTAPSGRLSWQMDRAVKRASQPAQPGPSARGSKTASQSGGSKPGAGAGKLGQTEGKPQARAPGAQASVPPRGLRAPARPGQPGRILHRGLPEFVGAKQRVGIR